MMKMAEELNELKEETEALNKKPVKPVDEELKLVSGGMLPNIYSGFNVCQGMQLDPASGESSYHPSGISGHLDDKSVQLFECP